ncbi:hypothetical protein GCM10023194_37710 [Planotetraspora phitsanulokensis]|uniref:Uncharacterized protein n=1 Tax=Planotetraspora phitsanulokensis TaxID=575192 RepID=A0A8J3UAL5_9ACTN|nr:hypothetical protein [Planotetraspora phitsanulokensis]GII41267.1 hypothetical protein Pph01_62700 [Planotetraspora phitsanulokensis]
MTGGGRAPGPGTEAFIRDLEWLESLRAQIDTHTFRHDVAKFLSWIPLLLAIAVLGGLGLYISGDATVAAHGQTVFAWLLTVVAFACAWALAAWRWLLRPARRRLDRDRRRFAEATEMLRPRIGALVETERWSREMAQMVEMRFGRLPLDR